MKGKWYFLIRIIFIIACLLISLQQTIAQENIEQLLQFSISINDLVILFFASIFIVIAVLGVQKINPKSGKTWKKSSWMSNPFNFGNPVDFFHFVGYCLLASSFMGTLSFYLKFQEINMVEVTTLIFGSGILLGVKIAEIIFIKKFVDA